MPLTNDVEVAKLWLEQQKSLKEEFFLQVKAYKSHSKYFQLVVAGAIAGASYFQTHNLPITDNTFLWASALIAFTMVSAYLSLDILATQYSIMMTAERITLIERRLNKLLKSPFMFWESKVSELFYARFPGPHGVMSPDVGAGIYVSLLILLLPIAGPMYLYFFSLEPTTDGEKAICKAGLIICVLTAAILIYFLFVVFVLARPVARRELLRVEREIEAQIEEGREIELVIPGRGLKVAFGVVLATLALAVVGFVITILIFYRRGAP
jgi:hypothetical protein